jgi:long-chain fatty acid transport protein
MRTFCLVVLACLMPSLARAGGFSTSSYAPDHQTAVTTTPNATYINPAALTNVQGLRLFFDGTVAYRSAQYTRTKSDTPKPPGAPNTNEGKATLHNTFGVPTFALAYTVDDLAIGFGVFLPFGGAVSWDERKKFEDDPVYIGAVDSTARWHTIEALMATGYISAGFAYHLGRGVSLGLSGNLVYTRLELTQAMSASLDDNVLNEGRANLQLDGWNGSFGAGLQWEMLPQVAWLGLSYQAPPGLWQGMLTEGDLNANFRTGLTTERIRLEEDFPDIINAGLRLRPSTPWELRLSGNYQRFSSVKSQCLARERIGPCTIGGSGLAEPNSGPFVNLVRRWNDTWGARLAASHFFGQQGRYEVLAAAAYDGSAVPDQTLEPGVVDGHDLIGTLGGHITFARRFILGASFTQLWMIPRDNSGKSRLAHFSSPNRLPSADGRYKQMVSLFNLNFEARFN